MIVLNPFHTAMLENTNEVTGLCVFSRKDTVHPVFADPQTAIV